jgi:prolyl-tRNA synthetase
MGGKSSHEFMVLAESGEDGLVECTACSYAANLERAERAQSHSAPDNQDSPEKPESVDTPGARTVEEVAQFLKRPQDQLVKTLIYIADGKPVAILAAGDREVNENKVMRHLGVDSVELADDATIEKVTKAPVGFAGPSGLEIAVYADFDLEGRSNVITGGNKQDTHMTGINIARDVNVTSYHDFCVPAEGDPCPRCREPMAERRGIEIGHVFKLGTKYSKTLGARFLDESGTEQPAIMGCYGIGVTRTLQAVIEQCHDEKGIIWPVPVAPYNVAVLLLDPAHDEAARITSELTEKLESENLSVIVDERDERPGVKFNDSELLGFPIQAVIGKRSLAKQSIEISYRQSGKKELVPVEEAAERIAEYCKTPC